MTDHLAISSTRMRSKHYGSLLGVLHSTCNFPTVLWGERSAKRATCKTKRARTLATKAQSNKTGHAALSACVGDVTFSCKDAASPSTQSFDRGVLKRSEGVKSFWNSGLHRVERGDDTSGLYASKPQHEYSNCTVKKGVLR